MSLVLLFFRVAVLTFPNAETQGPRCLSPVRLSTALENRCTHHREKVRV